MRTRPDALSWPGRGKARRTGNRADAAAGSRPPLSPPARIAAAAIALVAWTGIGLQLQASAASHGSLAAALWAMLRFFTVISNLLLALLLGAIALGSARAARPRLLGGIVLTILLVGVVYLALLRGRAELDDGVALVGVLLHEVTPPATALIWLAFAPKGRLGRGDPLWWTALPLAYLGYALARGAVEGGLSLSVHRRGGDRVGADAGEFGRDCGGVRAGGVWAGGGGWDAFAVDAATWTVRRELKADLCSVSVTPIGHDSAGTATLS